MIKRHSEWPTLLEQILNDRRLIPFCWGSNDCATGADIIIEHITGVSIMKPYRGRYTSALEAHRIFKREGTLLELTEIECAKHGVSQINKKQAQRGCLCAVQFNDIKHRTQISLAVVTPGGAMLPGPTGLTFYPFDHIITAWKI